MKKLIPLLFITILLIACQSPTEPQSPPSESTKVATPTPVRGPVATETIQPAPLPAEFIWKLTGDPNPFNVPVGVTVDPQGTIYVMDTENTRVQKFDSDGEFILMWGSPGSDKGQFGIRLQDEGRLALDQQGNVYVLDDSNFRVQKFDSNGNYLTQWGTKGNEEGQFAEPSDIAIDQQNNIYIVDYLNRVVQKFDEDGNLLLRWGSSGNKDGEFEGIYSVAIDPAGNVLVAEESGRIQKFDSNGNFLFKISPPPVDAQFIQTWNIAVDGQGNIYIADHRGFRIVKLDSQGNFLAVWRGKDTGPDLFNSLQDIAVDEQGNIYFTDNARNIVQKFRPPAFYP